MTDELKAFITTNKHYFMSNDFTKLFDMVGRSIRKELVEFLFNQAKINPLQYMQIIPSRMFAGVSLATLLIPSNIKKIEGDAFMNSEIKTIIIESSDTELVENSFSNNNGITTITLPEGYNVLPSMLFANCYALSRVNLPVSVRRIKPNAFVNCDDHLRIVTPYRENKADKLTIPSSEVDFYKQHLRFTHAPKEASDDIQA